MALFNFENEFKLNIPEVDREHEQLINTLNRTYELLNAGKRDEAHILFTQTLSEYVHEHFTNEEIFMKSFHYPKLEDHKTTHANFRSSFERLAPKIAMDDDAAFREALSDTYAWIISHIGTTDKRYAQYYFERYP